MGDRFPKLPNLAGDRIFRRVSRERVIDESGHEFGAGESENVTQAFDGAEEQEQHADLRQLACGHVHRIGGSLAKCDSCSQKAGRPAYVCSACSVICPITGEALCLRCTKLGTDGRRYSPNGFKQAKKMGLFDQVQNAPICTPSRGSLPTRVVLWIRDRW